MVQTQGKENGEGEGRGMAEEKRGRGGGGKGEGEGEQEAGMEEKGEEERQGVWKYIETIHLKDTSDQHNLIWLKEIQFREEIECSSTHVASMTDFLLYSYLSFLSKIFLFPNYKTSFIF